MQKVFALLIAVLSSINVNAQWQTHGPYGGRIFNLAVSGSNIFAGTLGAGVFLSNNNGSDWKAVNNGLSTNATKYSSGDKRIAALAAQGSNIFASIYSQDGSDLYSSSNNGDSWSKLNVISSAYVTTVLINGSYIFAGTNGKGIRLSSDNGVNWKRINTGLTDSNITSLSIMGSNIFAGTYSKGIFLSKDSGNNWIAASNGLVGGPEVDCFAVKDSIVYAGTNNGVYFSSDTGAHWLRANTGLPGGVKITSLIIKGSDLFAGIFRYDFYPGYGVYRSSDGGNTWVAANNGLTSGNIYALAAMGANIFAGSADGGLFLSTDNGSSWSAVNKGITNTSTTALLTSGADILMGSYESVFLSHDNGTNWIQANTGLNSVRYVRAFTKNKSGVFVAGYATDTGNVCFSSNNGVSWITADSGFKKGNNDYHQVIETLTANDSLIFGGSGADGGVFLSKDNGRYWSSVSTGLPSQTSITTVYLWGGNVFAGTCCFGVYKSTDYGGSWMAINNGYPGYDVNAFATIGNTIFMGSDVAVYSSTDSGAHWAIDSNGLPRMPVHALLSAGTYLFAGTYAGVYMSSNNGGSWSPVGLTNYTIASLTIKDTLLFAGVDGGSVWSRPLSEILPCYAHFKLYPDMSVQHHWYALNQSSGKPPLNYSWNWGDGSVAGMGDTVSHTYNTPSYYPICLTITDSTGCTITYCDSSTYVYKNDGNPIITVNVVNKLPLITGDLLIETNTPAISIYPNPATQQLFIAATGFVPEWLTVYDISGKKVAEQKFASQLDVSKLITGMYFIELRNANVVERSRFVKE